MAIFEENTLKPEEVQSGFSAGEPDDDSFMVGPDDDYYGDLPPDIQAAEGNIEAALDNFLGANEEKIDSFSSAPEMTADTETDSNVGMAWDVFEEENEPESAGLEPLVLEEEESLPAIAKEPLEQDEEPLQSVGFEPDEKDDLAGDSKLDDNDFAERLINNDIDDTTEPSYKTDDAIFDDIPPAPVTETIEVEKTEQMQMEDLLDDDLKKMLMQELEDSKARREKIQSSKPEIIQSPKSEEELKNDLASFESVDDLDEAAEFDLSEIEAEHPSQYNPEEELVKKKPAEDEVPKIESKPASVKIIDEEFSKEDYKEPEPKKKRRKSAFALFGFAAAAIVLLTAIGVAIYYFMYYPSEEISTAQAESTKTDTLVLTKKDTVKFTEKIHDTTGKAEEKIPEKIITPKEEPKQQPKIVVAETPVMKPEPKPQPPKHEPKTVIEEKPKAIAQKPMDTKPKPSITQKPVVKPKETQPRPTKTELTQPQEDIAETITKDTKEPTTALKHTEAIYVVQVYASPSEEDANMWLERLKNKNVKNLFISKQIIRDKTWYRVRFGSFPTREEAHEAAIKLGYSQSWVDRVR